MVSGHLRRISQRRRHDSRSGKGDRCRHGGHQDPAARRRQCRPSVKCPALSQTPEHHEGEEDSDSILILLRLGFVTIEKPDWLDSGLGIGIGKYTWKNGNTYDGHWKQGLTNGIGKYRWVKEKATYEGPFKDGQLESVEIEASVETPEKESK